MIYILVKKMFTLFNLMGKGTRLRSNGLNDICIASEFALYGL